MDPAMLAKIQAMPDGALKEQMLRYAAMMAGPQAGSMHSTTGAIGDAIGSVLPAPTLNPATVGPTSQGIADAAYSPMPAAPPAVLMGAQGATSAKAIPTPPTIGQAVAAVPALGVPAVAGMYAASHANYNDARIAAGKDNALEQMPHKAGNFSAAPRAVVGAMPEGPPRGSPQFVADIDKLQAQGAIGADTAASMKAKLAADEKARADRRAELEGKQFSADTNSKWQAERPDLAAKAQKRADASTPQPVTEVGPQYVGQSPAQPAAPEGSWAHAVGNAFRFGGA